MTAAAPVPPSGRGWRAARASGVALGLVLLAACDDAPARESAEEPAPAWAWGLPPGIAAPIVPDDNPMTAAKVELGRHLFHDVRLSVDGTQSCATCHRPELAFTDGLPRAELMGGELHPRSTPSLGNVAYAAWLGWANPVLVRLEAHAVVPILGDDPPELGWNGRERELEARLAAEPVYQRLFAEAYPDEDGAEPAHHPEPARARERITLRRVVLALAAFERTLVSTGAPFDRHLAGDQAALDAPARRGLALFESERVGCSGCHSGWTTSDATIAEDGVEPGVAFHNTGLYDVDGTGAYPPTSPGLVAATGRPEDMGKFRTPSLRNVTVTAPYMHDGSVPDLDAVIDHYARGGRLVTGGPDAGDGRDNRWKSERVRGFSITDAQRADLVAFLHALTDEGFLGDPRFADPWPRAAGAAD